MLRYDAKCDVWSIGCILWDMANTANTFVFVSHYNFALLCVSVLLLCFCLSVCVQELSNHVGLNVAQASSESIGAREIHELIEKDVPQVIHSHIIYN